MENPFVAFFEFGANADEYWDGNAMGEQVENCLNCIHVLLYPNFQVVGQFDWSAGHGKKKKAEG